MTNSIITLMGLFIILMFVAYIGIIALSLNATLRKGYMDIDEKCYKYKARRRMYYYY